MPYRNMIVGAIILGWLARKNEMAYEGQQANDAAVEYLKGAQMAIVAIGGNEGQVMALAIGALIKCVNIHGAQMIEAWAESLPRVH